jgi:ketosteroid isomerase-like protein
MKSLAAALALTLVLGVPALAASPYHHIPADLAQAAEAYDEAQVHGDGAALERLVADDYVLISGGAVVQDKAKLIHDYVDPNFHLDPFVIQEPVERVWGDGAVLGGLVDMTGTDGGQRFSQLVRFADVWAKRDGQWRVVYTQVTRVPAS